MITPRGVAKNLRPISVLLDEVLMGLDDAKMDIDNLSPEDLKYVREAIAQIIVNTEGVVDNLNDVIYELQTHKGN